MAQTYHRLQMQLGKVFVVVIAIGWVMNLLVLVNQPILPLTTMMIARAIGVVLFPIGAVLGYV